MILEDEEEEEAPPAPDPDEEEDEDQGNLSLAAMEAALKPQVLDTLERIAGYYGRLAEMQDDRISATLNRDESFTSGQERDYQRLRSEIVELVNSLHLHQNRIDTLVDQLYGINRKIMSLDTGDREARRPGARQPPGVHRRVPRLRARARLARPRRGEEDPRLGPARHPLPRQGRRGPRRDGRHRPARRRRHLRVPPHRQPGAEGREGGPPGQEGDGRGQPPARDLDRQEVHQPRAAVPRPDPGGQHRPDEGGRQVRVPPRLQVLDLRHLVDPPGDHPLASPTRRGRSASRCT